MGKTRKPAQKTSPTPATVEPVPTPAPGLQDQLGNAALNELVLARQGGGEAKAAVPETPFVDLGDAGKTSYLVGLMDRSRSVLDANGVSPHMESKMAGLMHNEASRNLRRQSLGNAFVDHAEGLQRKLKGVDLEALKADPDRRKAFLSGLSEEQRHLYEKVEGGSIDLAGLSSKDPAVKAAARDQVTEAGIELRANQYMEMQELMKKDEKKLLSQPESARLAKLRSLQGSQIGMSGTRLADISGMSKDRFKEIYAEGQSRFEPAQYTAFKRDWENGLKQRQAKKNPNLPIELSAGIGTFGVTADMEKQLATNLDLLADMTTSYGSSQIMGAYGVNGGLSAKNPDGTKRTFTLADLKASGERLSPNSDDVQMQIAFLNMKGINVGSTTLSDSAITQSYNGAAPGTADHTTYMNRLSSRSSAYKAAK